MSLSDRLVDLARGRRRSAVPVDAEAASTDRALRPSPFLHDEGSRFLDPLTDRELGEGDPGFRALRAVADGLAAPADLDAPERTLLAEGGWLVGTEEDLSRRFHLKYVSLEAHTVCNQGCYFCPVAHDRREPYFMPTEQYRDIVDQLAAHRETIEAVFMINYNEPTADKRFVDQVRTLHEAGLPPATLTNATGLTPQRVDALLEIGGLRFLSINLSTLDPERYAADREGDHLELVLRHLDYVKDLPLADQMDIVVLGQGDEVHDRDFAEIGDRFAGTRFNVKRFEVMDRAGYLQIGLKARNESLCGCENVGSRPLQHLHITPHGKCVLCCEDYDERYVVGDLGEETVDEVLTGPRFALMRRWVYGIEEAPADFICRDCIFARTGRKAAAAGG